MNAWAAILAGGAGTRFWPLSTPDRPKQLLPLTGDRPLLAQAVARLRGLVPPERTLILTSPSLVDQVAATVPEIPAANIFAEPRAASTAPALAWAAQWITKRDPSGQMLSLHADWAVGDDRAFRAAAGHALGVAQEHDVLVTVGVKPSRNETGYGYIVPGKPLGSARRVKRFVEKPTPARAAMLRRRGALWNSGLFAWGAARFLGEAGGGAQGEGTGLGAAAGGARGGGVGRGEILRGGHAGGRRCRRARAPRPARRRGRHVSVGRHRIVGCVAPHPPSRCPGQRRGRQGVAG